MALDLDGILGDCKIGGKTPFRKLEDDLWSDIPFWISTGAPSLDYAIGGYRPGFKGGIPFGRCTEINGPESSAKSTLLDNIIKNFLDTYEAVVLLGDREHAHEVRRLTELGIDATNLRFIERPREGDLHSDFVLEEFFEITEMVFRRIRKASPETPILVALDSLAATSTRMQIDAISKADPDKKGLSSYGMREQMDKSIIMSRFFPEFCSLITESNAVLIIVNQLRQKPGVLYGDPTYSPGGETLKFSASLRIKTSKGDEIKPSDDPIREHWGDFPVGMTVKFKTTKNKVAPPWRTGTFPLFFDDRGIHYETCLVDMIIDFKCWEKVVGLEKSGAWFSWGGERIAQGKGNLVKAFMEDHGLMEEIEKECFMKEGVEGE